MEEVGSSDVVLPNCEGGVKDTTNEMDAPLETEDGLLISESIEQAQANMPVTVTNFSDGLPCGGGVANAILEMDCTPPGDKLGFEKLSEFTSESCEQVQLKTSLNRSGLSYEILPNSGDIAVNTMDGLEVSPHSVNAEQCEPTAESNELIQMSTKMEEVSSDELSLNCDNIVTDTTQAMDVSPETDGVQQCLPNSEYTEQVQPNIVRREPLCGDIVLNAALSCSEQDETDTTHEMNVSSLGSQLEYAKIGHLPSKPHEHIQSNPLVEKTDLPGAETSDSGNIVEEKTLEVDAHSETEHAEEHEQILKSFQPIQISTPMEKACSDAMSSDCGGIVTDTCETDVPLESESAVQCAGLFTSEPKTTMPVTETNFSGELPCGNSVTNAIHDMDVSPVGGKLEFEKHSELKSESSEQIQSSTPVKMTDPLDAVPSAFGDGTKNTADDMEVSSETGVAGQCESLSKCYKIMQPMQSNSTVQDVGSSDEVPLSCGNTLTGVMNEMDASPKTEGKEQCVPISEYSDQTQTKTVRIAIDIPDSVPEMLDQEAEQLNMSDHCGTHNTKEINVSNHQNKLECIIEDEQSCENSQSKYQIQKTTFVTETNYSDGMLSKCTDIVSDITNQIDASSETNYTELCEPTSESIVPMQTGESLRQTNFFDTASSGALNQEEVLLISTPNDHDVHITQDMDVSKASPNKVKCIEESGTVISEPSEQLKQCIPCIKPTEPVYLADSGDAISLSQVTLDEADDCSRIITNQIGGVSQENNLTSESSEQEKMGTMIEQVGSSDPVPSDSVSDIIHEIDVFLQSDSKFKKPCVLISESREQMQVESALELINSPSPLSSEAVGEEAVPLNSSYECVNQNIPEMQVCEHTAQVQESCDINSEPKQQLPTVISAEEINSAGMAVSVDMEEISMPVPDVIDPVQLNTTDDFAENATHMMVSPDCNEPNSEKTVKSTYQVEMETAREPIDSSDICISPENRQKLGTALTAALNEQVQIKIQVKQSEHSCVLLSDLDAIHSCTNNAGANSRVDLPKLVQSVSKGLFTSKTDIDEGKTRTDASLPCLSNIEAFEHTSLHDKTYSELHMDVTETEEQKELSKQETVSTNVDVSVNCVASEHNVRSADPAELSDFSEDVVMNIRAESETAVALKETITVEQNDCNPEAQVSEVDESICCEPVVENLQETPATCSAKKQGKMVCTQKATNILQCEVLDQVECDEDVYKTLSPKSDSASYEQTDINMEKPNSPSHQLYSSNLHSSSEPELPSKLVDDVSEVSAVPGPETHYVDDIVKIDSMPTLQPTTSMPTKVIESLQQLPVVKADTDCVVKLSVIPEKSTEEMTENVSCLKSEKECIVKSDLQESLLTFEHGPLAQDCEQPEEADSRSSQELVDHSVHSFMDMASSNAKLHTKEPEISKHDIHDVCLTENYKTVQKEPNSACTEPVTSGSEMKVGENVSQSISETRAVIAENANSDLFSVTSRPPSELQSGKSCPEKATGKQSIVNEKLFNELMNKNLRALAPQMKSSSDSHDSYVSSSECESRKTHSGTSNIALAEDLKTSASNVEADSKKLNVEQFDPKPDVDVVQHCKNAYDIAESANAFETSQSESEADVGKTVEQESKCEVDSESLYDTPVEASEPELSEHIKIGASQIASESATSELTEKPHCVQDFHEVLPTSISLLDNHTKHPVRCLLDDSIGSVPDSSPVSEAEHVYETQPFSINLSCNEEALKIGKGKDLAHVPNSDSIFGLVPCSDKVPEDSSKDTSECQRYSVDEGTENKEVNVPITKSDLGLELKSVSCVKESNALIIGETLLDSCTEHVSKSQDSQKVAISSVSQRENSDLISELHPTDSSTVLLNELNIKEQVKSSVGKLIDYDNSLEAESDSCLDSLQAAGTSKQSAVQNTHLVIESTLGEKNNPKLDVLSVADVSEPNKSSSYVSGVSEALASEKDGTCEEQCSEEHQDEPAQTGQSSVTSDDDDDDIVVVKEVPASTSQGRENRRYSVFERFSTRSTLSPNVTMRPSTGKKRFFKRTPVCDKDSEELNSPSGHSDGGDHICDTNVKKRLFDADKRDSVNEILSDSFLLSEDLDDMICLGSVKRRKTEDESIVKKAESASSPDCETRSSAPRPADEDRTGTLNQSNCSNESVGILSESFLLENDFEASCPFSGIGLESDIGASSKKPKEQQEQTPSSKMATKENSKPAPTGKVSPVASKQVLPKTKFASPSTKSVHAQAERRALSRPKVLPFEKCPTTPKNSVDQQKPKLGSDCPKSCSKVSVKLPSTSALKIPTGGPRAGPQAPTSGKKCTIPTGLQKPSLKRNIPIVASSQSKAHAAPSGSRSPKSPPPSKRIKTPSKYMNVSSPVRKYIEDVPAPPLVEIVKPKSKISSLKPASCIASSSAKATPVKSTTSAKSTPGKSLTITRPSDCSYQTLPTVKYCPKQIPKVTSISQLPKPVLKVQDNQPNPVIQKHIGPKRIIPGARYLKNEESILDSSRLSQIPSDMNTTVVHQVNVTHSNTIGNAKKRAKLQ